jgi:hypothetical protein
MQPATCKATVADELNNERKAFSKILNVCLSKKGPPVKAGASFVLDWLSEIQGNYIICNSIATLDLIFRGCSQKIVLIQLLQCTATAALNYRFL